MQPELTAQIDALYEKDDFGSIIRLLEQQPSLDYEASLRLAQAYINAGNTMADGYELQEKAHTVLDKVAIEGKDDPKWLFYKGYALYKQGLVYDALLRFERAQQHVGIGSSASPALFANISSMLQACRTTIMESEFKGLGDRDKARIVEHIEKEFGRPNKLFSSLKVDVYQIDPTPEHNYNVLLTCGLSGKVFKVPKGFDQNTNSRMELALILPASYRFKQDKDADWPIYLLIDLIEHVIASTSFIGFGYYVSKGATFSKATSFSGVMLTALGEYPGQKQSVVMEDNSVSLFFQVIPLLPDEISYREQHTAGELLELFKNRNIPLTPTFDGRENALSVDMKLQQNS